MNRRGFLKFLGAGAATLALSEAIPFGRVWSFPSKIVLPEPEVAELLVGNQLLTVEFITRETLRVLAAQLDHRIIHNDWDRNFAVGDIVSVTPLPSPALLRFPA